MQELKNIGVNLTGGGARGSYQAGVLKGISEILAEVKMTGAKNPLRYWSAVSAGSINATACAAGLHEFETCVQKLTHLWENVTPDQVYLSDFSSLSANGARWLRDLTVGPFLKTKKARSLLNTKPLWNLIRENIDFSQLNKNISSGVVQGLACSAYSYYNNRTVTFLQTKQAVAWDKPRRYSVRTQIQPEHIIASCSIPMLFPATPIGNEYLADGSFRNTSPISPVIHMGAKKILVIGVRGPNETYERNYTAEPTVAKVAGSILNALFFDTTDIDLERVQHINELVSNFKKEIVTQRSDYSAIHCLTIRPSRDISKIAEEKFKNFPKMIKFMIGGLGPRSESSELASYILFVPEFTRELVRLGYADAMNMKDEIKNFLLDRAE